MAKVSDLTVDGLQTIIKNMMEAALVNVATKENIQEFKNEILVLKNENIELKGELSRLRLQLEHIDRENRQKKLLFKGLDDTPKVREAIQEVMSTKLKMSSPIPIGKATKMYSSGGKMTVMLECLSHDDTWKVLNNSRNLIGTTISIDRDLSVSERDQRRKLVHIKKEIEQIDNSKIVRVRGNQLKIENHTFHWRNDTDFVCGKYSGLEKLKQIYGKDFSRMNIEGTVTKPAEKGKKSYQV